MREVLLVAVGLCFAGGIYCGSLTLVNTMTYFVKTRLPKRTATVRYYRSGLVLLEGIFLAIVPHIDWTGLVFLTMAFIVTVADCLLIRRRVRDSQLYPYAAASYRNVELRESNIREFYLDITVFVVVAALSLIAPLIAVS